MEVLLKNQPEGVQLSVKEVSEQDDFFPRPGKDLEYQTYLSSFPRLDFFLCLLPCVGIQVRLI